MDLKQIKQVIDLMKRSDLSEFEVEDEGFRLRIKRGPGEAPAISSGSAAAPMAHTARAGAAAHSAPAPHGAATEAATPEDGGEKAGFAYVKSPMVGTFYRSPSPENPPFVDANSKVDEKTVVCIIEAMKIMNEIQAEAKGTIVEILVENGQPVEYGQRLFRIKLS